MIINFSMLGLGLVLVCGAMYLFHAATGAVERKRTFEPKEVVVEESLEAVRWISYDVNTRSLIVFFRDGPREDYANVDPAFFEDYETWESPTKFYEEKVKGKLPFQ